MIYRKFAVLSLFQNVFWNSKYFSVCSELSLPDLFRLMVKGKFPWKYVWRGYCFSYESSPEDGQMRGIYLFEIWVIDNSLSIIYGARKEIASGYVCHRIFQCVWIFMCKLFWNSPKRVLWQCHWNCLFYMFYDLVCGDYL